MPELFVDHSVQYPRRFEIIADGTNGTVNDPALDGKVVELKVEAGSVFVQGTNLNAEELNKRIIGDFEEKTFTQLRTLLDTLNIDADQNANMVVNKILMRTAYQQVANGDAVTSVVSDASSTSIGINTDGTWEFANSYESSNQKFPVVLNRRYLLLAKALNTSVGLMNRVVLKHDDNSEQSASSQDSLFVFAILTSNKTGLANFKIREGQAGQIDKDFQMFIDVTGLSDKGLSDDEIIGNYLTYFEGKAKTVNPKLLTIGKNLLEVGKNGDSESNVTVERIGNGLLKINSVGVLTSNIRFNILDLIQFGISADAFKALGFTIPTVNGKDYTTSSEIISGSQTVGGTQSTLVVIGDSVTFASAEFGTSETELAVEEDVETVYLLLRSGTTFNDLVIKVQFEAKDSASDILEYNSNEANKFGFLVEGNSISNDGVTKEDTVELINNRYKHIHRVGEEGVEFQSIGGVSGNWAVNGLAGVKAPFSTFGFDIDPALTDGINTNNLFVRLIVDGVIFEPEDALFPADLHISITTNGFINVHDATNNNPVLFAALIAAANEVIFDFYIAPEDWEEKDILSTGFTVIEENGTIIEENEESIAFETETEIPVNIPAAIETNTKDIRRLSNIKLEAIPIEDFSELALDVPSLSSALFIELTDNNEFDLYYAMVAHQNNAGLVVPVFFTKIAGTTGLTVFPENKIIEINTIGGTNLIYTMVIVKYDKSTLKFTIGGSNKITTTAITFVQDNTLESKVYAVYGLRAAKGDPRND